MATTFAELKKTRGDSLKKLTEKMAANTKPQGESSSYDDNRFWTLTVDKTGNGKAVIRFLPAPQGEDNEWAQTFSHAFQGPTGAWYIENSLATVGKEDPVAELNRALWNTGLEVNKNRARAQKRKLNYYANIFVVSDPAKPENDGKVFLFKFGKQIFDLLQAAAVPPEEEDEEDEETVKRDPFDPFDPWTGADLTLRASIDTKTKMRTYVKSKFGKNKPISEDNKETERIWLACHPLAPFTDAENTKMFKTYDQLKTRLNLVLGVGSAAQTAAAPVGPKAIENNTLPIEESPFVDDVETDEDKEAMALFNKLAKKG